MDNYTQNTKKLLEAKMLLDTFEIPKRPMSLSAHQYKKRFGSNQGYSEYKKTIKQQRQEWDALHKALYKNNKQKSKYLLQIDLSDDALQQAEVEARRQGLTVPEILCRWLEKGRES